MEKKVIYYYLQALVSPCKLFGKNCGLGLEYSPADITTAEIKKKKIFQAVRQNMTCFGGRHRSL